MRMSAIVISGMAFFLVAGKSNTDPGEVYIPHKNPRVSKDYYIVREGQSGKCSIKSGQFGDAPAGAVGNAPYASKDYAKAALKTSPECKGGEAADDDVLPRK